MIYVTEGELYCIITLSVPSTTAARMATYRSPKVSTHQSCNTNFGIQFQITLQT